MVPLCCNLQSGINPFSICSRYNSHSMGLLQCISDYQPHYKGEPKENVSPPRRPLLLSLPKKSHLCCKSDLRWFWATSGFPGLGMHWYIVTYPQMWEALGGFLAFEYRMFLFTDSKKRSWTWMSLRLGQCATLRRINWPCMSTTRWRWR